MIDAATYAIERAICDKADATMRAGWPEHAKGGAIPQAVCEHADWKACNNEMRGRVEQYEILRDLPETIFAYVGEGKRNGMGIDRIVGQTHAVTVWTGLPIGYATMGNSFRSGFGGTKQHMIYARIGGREYVGRGQGVGMCVRLKETAKSKRDRA